MKKIFPVVLVIALSACSTAKKSNEIEAAYFPSAPYERMTCNELYDEAEKLRSQVPGASQAADKAYKSDKNKEVVAWVLFAPAALFLSGNADEQQKLSQIKGQLEAIRIATEKNKCASSPASPAASATPAATTTPPEATKVSN